MWLWCTADWTPAGQPLEAHSLTVTQMAFSSTGQHLLTVSRDRTFAVWGRQAAGKLSGTCMHIREAYHFSVSRIPGLQGTTASSICSTDKASFDVAIRSTWLCWVYQPLSLRLRPLSVGSASDQPGVAGRDTILSDLAYPLSLWSAMFMVRTTPEYVCNTCSNALWCAQPAA